MLEDIEYQLDRLKQLDGKDTVFGANGHRYRSTPIAHQELTLFEHTLGVQLPEEYRAFLLRIGAGAGPYYGLWSPKEVLEEQQMLVADFQEDTGLRVDPSGPFPITSTNLGVLTQRETAGEQAPLLAHPWPSGGCIPICHQGCTFWSTLVLSGEFRGHVWDVACYVGFDGEWIPAHRPPGVLRSNRELPPLPRPPTFLQWVHGWLQRCLTDFDAL